MSNGGHARIPGRRDPIRAPVASTGCWMSHEEMREVKAALSKLRVFDAEPTGNPELGATASGGTEGRESPQA